MSVRILLLLIALQGQAVLAADADPLQSVMWEYHHRACSTASPTCSTNACRCGCRRSPRTRGRCRSTSMRVPWAMVVRIEAWADLNPIPRIFTFVPGDHVLPLVAIRIRVEQATPVRAAVLTRDGVCMSARRGSMPPVVHRAQRGARAARLGDRLGEVIGGRFVRGDFSRLRLQVLHPMDNGLVGGIPEFFLNQAELRAADGRGPGSARAVSRVAENPASAWR